MQIWSKRFSVAWGERWVSERQCDKHDAGAWLRIFADHEPGVVFVAADKAPPLEAKPVTGPRPSRLSPPADPNV